MANDYPDGFRRLLPGNTVDLTTGFARPWYIGTTLNIASGDYSTYTITINDPDSIYYIDVVNVSAQSVTDFGVRVYINNIAYAAESCTGFAHIPMRTNPSIFLISDDSIQVVIHNFDASARSYEIKVHGTKIIRPVVFGHTPGAYFTVHSHTIDVLTAALFSDASTFTPTAWEWDFKDGQPKSYTQSPWTVYKTPGSYYPLLKASNLYGYDTYAEQVPVVCNPVLYPPGWTQYDPFDNISVDSNSVTITNTPTNYGIYCYLDLDYLDLHAFVVTFCLQVSKMEAGSRHCFIKFAGSLSPEDSETVGSVGIEIIESAGQHVLLLRASLVDHSVDDGYTGVPIDNTPLYFKIQHSAGSDTVSLNIFSDAAQTNLLAALSITDNDFKTLTYRFLYLTRGTGSSSTGQITAKLSDITYYYL